MVINIFIKPERKRPLIPVERLEFTTHGIIGNVSCLPLRQVLILPTGVLKEFQLKPGDLRENLVIHYDALHELPSGTVLRVGEARIRLTFHCEPCTNIKDKVKTVAILHKRGYLGKFLNQGAIRIGDEIENLGVMFEPIPYNLKERLLWYLSRQDKPIFLTQVLAECGFSLTYARAVPNILKSMPKAIRDKVLFKSRKMALISKVER